MILELALALGMQDATTTCTTVYGQTTCNTHQRPGWPTGSGMDSYNRAREAAVASPPVPADMMRCAGGDWFLAGCTLGAHREAVRLRDVQAARDVAHQRAMTLLRQGDCRGAIAAALDTDDLTFATDVRAFCAAGPTPTP